MVSVGYTQFVPATGEGSEGVRALRAIRALRPLRTITRINSLRSVVVCFMEAIPMLASVATMLIFFLFVFAVAGVQLFSEVYHMACVDVSPQFYPDSPLAFSVVSSRVARKLQAPSPSSLPLPVPEASPLASNAS